MNTTFPPTDCSGTLGAGPAAAERAMILRCLRVSPGYTSNDGILLQTLQHMGERISRACLMRHLHWLHDQGLLKLRAYSEGFGTGTAVQLLANGDEVAQGLPDGDALRPAEAPASVTSAREFVARRLAAQRAITAGAPQQACAAQCLAARLYAQGRSVDAAARIAAAQVAQAAGGVA